MVCETGKKWGKELRIAYTNVDGLLSVRYELEEYLKIKKPDIMAITETKLSEEREAHNTGEGNYKVWKRNRKDKQGGGVMFLIKKNITIEDVKYGKGLAEVLKVSTKGMNRRKRDFAVVYVPPKTDAWSKAEYDEILMDTKEFLEDMIKESENISIMGDLTARRYLGRNGQRAAKRTPGGISY